MREKKSDKIYVRKHLNLDIEYNTKKYLMLNAIEKFSYIIPIAYDVSCRMTIYKIEREYVATFTSS